MFVFGSIFKSQVNCLEPEDEYWSIRVLCIPCNWNLN